MGTAMYQYNKVESQQTMSHASPAFWLDSVESTADLLADIQSYPPEIVNAVEEETSWVGASLQLPQSPDGIARGEIRLRQ